MSMSGRELEEMRRLANEAYSQPVAARYERTLARYLLSVIDEVRRSHAEAAEQKETIEKLRGMVGHAEDTAAEWMDRCHDCERVGVERGQRIDELEVEAAELREELQSLETLNSDLTKARDRASARLREEEKNRAWERTRAEELVMCKSHELGELRERAGELADTLDKVSNCAPIYPETGRFYLVPEYLFKEVRAALSQANAQAKLETRSEEEEK